MELTAFIPSVASINQGVSVSNQCSHGFISKSSASARSRRVISNKPIASSRSALRMSSEATDIYKLGTLLAGAWSNKKQNSEFPSFWSYIHVCNLPLPVDFFASQGSPESVSFYTESVYDFQMSRPYRNSVIRVIKSADGSTMELETYKLVTDITDYYFATKDKQKVISSLSCENLRKLPDGCNTIFEWNPVDKCYNGFTRPGKTCLTGKGGYLSSTFRLVDGYMKSWETGRDEKTDEMVWGPAGGPFEFIPTESWRDQVPVVSQ
mmetsp:Transcript_18677/g.32434  ORF Transcript_18677/g.32434 Transcript_18677/m.32434 type:complete len:265 (+) Transcript_18677:82-876(+)